MAEHAPAQQRARRAALGERRRELRSVVIVPSISATRMRGSSQALSEVGGERQQHVDEREQQHDRLRHREVLVGDRLVGEVAEPVEREDGLDHDRAAEQEAELHGGERHHRHQRVAQRVLEDDAGARQALGARGADVVGGEHLDHAGAHQPHERRRHVVAERDGRHHEMRPACRCPRPAASAGRSRTA